MYFLCITQESYFHSSSVKTAIWVKLLDFSIKGAPVTCEGCGGYCLSAICGQKKNWNGFIDLSDNNYELLY